MIWSQVTGLVMSRPAFSAKDFRYHSTWVFAQNGAATSLSSQVAPWTAPLSDSLDSDAASSAGSGSR